MSRGSRSGMTVYQWGVAWTSCQKKVGCSRFLAIGRETNEFRFLSGLSDLASSTANVMCMGATFPFPSRPGVGFHRSSSTENCSSFGSLDERGISDCTSEPSYPPS